MRFFRLFLILAGFFAGLTSCEVNKPTYSKDTLVPALQQMLLEDYDIHALVKQTGKTLGVCITIPMLFTAGKKMSIVNDQIQNVMMCLRRVLLSTDAPIDFYQVTMRGQDSPGTEVDMVRYLPDLKIHTLWGISQEDFAKRMVYRTEVNVAALGKERVELFFKDLETQDPRQVLFSHFGSDMQYPSIPNDFSMQMHEAAMKLHLQYELTDLRMKAVNEETFYIYCKVCETFDPKQGFQDFNFSTHSGMTQTYLLKITTPGYYRAQIMEMFLKGDTDSGRQAKWDAVLRQLGDPESWPTSDFYVFPYDLKTFLAEQIADRVQSDLGNLGDSVQKPEEKTAKDKKFLLPRITNIRGFCENDSLKFLFHYRDPEKNVAKKDLEVTLATTKDVCETYHFRDFKNVSVGTPYGVYATYPV